VLPLTQIAWGMSAREAGMVQAAFHLGYLTSLFIVGFIADHFGAKRAYITTGVAACISPWAFVLFADGFWSAVWLHAFTGLCQGGTYTPALALINDHVERSRRGRAMGFLIAGSSAGYVEASGGRLPAAIRQQYAAERVDRDADRQVDEEDPVPVERTRQAAAEQHARCFLRRRIGNSFATVARNARGCGVFRGR